MKRGSAPYIIRERPLLVGTKVPSLMVLEGSEMSTEPIRVLIADAQPIVLEGLRSVLSQYPSIQLVAEASDGVETIDKVVHLEPDVVLLDLRLPRVDGLTVLRSI